MSCSEGINGTPSLSWRSAGCLHAKCRCCGADVELREVLSVSHVVRSKGDVVFYRCPDCGSVNAKGDFTDFESFEEFMWDQYLHIGAGIDSMVRPLERAGLIDGGRLLDVGCGYGFVLDYWRLIANGSAVGFEPSEYGARGARELDVHVIPGYLSDVDELRGQKFDRVFSSEVIEHVPDPLGFLRDLKARLADAGILVLTTPNAEFVRPDAPLSVLLAALSPGLHQMLFSKRALEDILKRAGFRYSIVEVVGERLVAYAADCRIALQENSRSERDNYNRYLRLKCEQTDSVGALGLGVRFRLHKELVNSGRLDEALPIANAMIDAIKAGYGVDPLTPEDCRKAVAGVATIEEYAERIPFFFPCFLFYVAMMVRHGRSVGGASAPDLFACAADLAGAAQRVSAQVFQEAASLYWVAVYEEGVARLVAGDRAAALRALERVVRGRETEAAHLVFCERSQGLIDRAAVQAGVAVLQSGDSEDAMRRFREVLARLRPGDELAQQAVEYWQIAERQAEEAVPRGHLKYGRSGLSAGRRDSSPQGSQGELGTISTTAPIVIAGQMRSGTTWLWEAFKSSPQVWVPPLKEFRLLNSIDLMGASTSFQRLTAQQTRKAGSEVVRHWYDETWRHYMKAAASQMSGWMERDFWREPFHSLQAREFEFWAAYLSRVHDLDLYKDLASLALPARLLDASPGYLACGEELLSRFSQRFPAAQIIVMLRDPFAQIVSFSKWARPGDEIKRSSSRRDIRAWLQSPPVRQELLKIGDGAEKLKKAIRVFGKDRIFLSTMDDIAEQPKAVLAALGEFLDVEIKAYPSSRVNESRDEDLSAEFLEEILPMALVEAEGLAKLVPALATTWRDNIRSMMAGQAIEAPRKVGELRSGPLKNLSA